MTSESIHRCPICICTSTYVQYDFAWLAQLWHDSVLTGHSRVWNQNHETKWAVNQAFSSPCVWLSNRHKQVFCMNTDTYTHKKHARCAKAERQAYRRKSSAVVIPSKHYLFNTIAHISVWVTVAYMGNIRGLFINSVCRQPGLTDDTLEELKKFSVFALRLVFCVWCLCKFKLCWQRLTASADSRDKTLLLL